MAEETPQRLVNPWIVAVSVMLATFMEVLDTTIVNVSLPHIAGTLSASVDESTWVLTSYFVANAVILPLTGWLASYFGRKRLLMASVSGFTIASILCGLAPNLSSLVFFRILQGTSGGGLQPLSQAVLLEAFPRRARGKAMGFWGLGIVVAPILGPVAGGWLTDNYSWRWIFYVNVPIGIASLIMTNLFISDPPYVTRRAGRIDYWGIGLLVLGIGSLQLLLDTGQRRDWLESHLIAALAVVAIVALVVFIVYEWRTLEPVVDLRVFKIRTYSTCVFLMLTLGFVLFGSLVLVPLMLQTLLGYSAVEAGIAMAPRGLGSLIGMPLIGLFIGRLDARKLVAAGLLTAGLTLFWLGRLDMDAGYWDIFWPQFVQGFGFSMLFVPLTTIAMDPIPRERIGNATSLFNLVRNIGGSVGIAVATTLLFRGVQAHTALLGARVDAYSAEAQAALEQARSGFLAQGSDPTTAVLRAYAVVFGEVQRQATMLSFLEVFWLLGTVFVLLIPLVSLMKRPRRSDHAPL